MIAARVSTGTMESCRMAQGCECIRPQPGIVIKHLLKASRSANRFNEIGTNRVAYRYRNNNDGDIQIACGHPQEYENNIRGDKYIYNSQLNWCAKDKIHGNIHDA